MEYFWKNYQYLCQKKGISIYEAAQKCGIKGTGTISYWRRGSKPNAENLKSISNFFNVTVPQLCHEDIEENEKAARAYAQAVDDPLYSAILKLSPQKRAVVEAFIAGINANPNMHL